MSPGKRNSALALILLALCAGTALAQTIVAGPARDRLRQQAMQLQSMGEYQSALDLMRQVVAQDPQPSNLQILLDLQVQLRLDDEANRSIALLEATIPGWPADFTGFQSLNTASRIAGALNRMGESDRADAIWKTMERNARDEMEASIVFRGFQDQRLFERAGDYVERQRKARSKPGLWAMEMAQAFEQQEHWAQAFDEYSLVTEYDSNARNTVGHRLLRLAEKAGPDSDLVDLMVTRALKEQARGREELARQVFEVCIQQKAYQQAHQLAGKLDPKGDEGLLQTLAHAAVGDGSFAMGLSLLDEIQTRQGTARTDPGLRMDRGLALEGLERPLEALAEYDTLALEPGPQALEAQLLAARLLHQRLDRAEEAIARLDRVLSTRPRELRAILYQIRLLGSTGRFTDAESLRVRGLEAARNQPDILVELEFLQIQLAWWSGRLSQAREGLTVFLQKESQHPIFNDAIDLMDLLAFAGSDSLLVRSAALADRQAWLTHVAQAVETLKTPEPRGSSGVREWLDWQACTLASRFLPVEAARAEQARYRLAHGESIRLDRLTWMEYEVLCRAGAPVAERQRILESLLEDWPESILQDQVRREIRQLDTMKTGTERVAG